MNNDASIAKTFPISLLVKDHAGNTAECEWESIYNGSVAVRQGDHMTHRFICLAHLSTEQFEVPGAVTVQKVHIW